jgi:hypothetical protein
MAARKAPLLDGELLEHVSTATNTTEEAMHCIQSHVMPRRSIQKRSRSHGIEHPKHSNSEERDNSTLEGDDLHTDRPEPTSGRELTNRRQNRAEHRRQTSQKTSEVKSLFFVV